ncbi:MAG: hypothetical protein EBW21_06230 [Actinobacteria bacterium]|nr:hypothetical protein [Actinomycetota bacterium]
MTTIGGLPIETGVVKLRLSELTDPVEFVETILKKYRVPPFKNEIGSETATGLPPETVAGIARPVFVALMKFGSVP